MEVNSGISFIGIWDKKLKPIVTRFYKNNLPNNLVELFNLKVLEYDDSELTPTIQIDELYFSFIKHENITFLVVSNDNPNLVMIFTFLENFKDLLLDYFINLDSDLIKENLVLIYELLDEVIDNGYPETLDKEILKNYIKTQQNKSLLKKKKKEKNKTNKVAHDLTHNIPWRTGVYKYSKNEVFLDVIEKVNMLINSNGNVINSEVEGNLRMKCRLSGFPELILGLNDKKYLEINENSNLIRI